MEEGKQVKKLPMTLGEALDALEKDEVIKKAMPDEMYRVFTNTSATSGRASCPPHRMGPGDVSRLPAVIERGEQAALK